MSRIRKGWELTKKSWALLRENPALIRFPLYGAVATIVCAVDRPRAGDLPDQRRPHGCRGGAGGDRLLPAGAGRHLLQRRAGGRGRHDLPRPGGDASATASPWPAPASARSPAGPRSRPLVGLVLSALESEGGIFGQIFGRLLDIGWSLITFLAVPVIALEGTGPLETLKRSAGLFRKPLGPADDRQHRDRRGRLPARRAAWSDPVVAGHRGLVVGELRRRAAGW